MLNDETEVVSAIDPRMTGVLAYNKQRKQSSRENLLAAAIKLFCERGYADVAIEDITAEAGVSRITYYRHFPGKAAIALELFKRVAETEGTPRILAIATLNFRDRATVKQWLIEYFAANRDIQGILRVLTQANIEEADFSKQAQPLIFDLIRGLGQKIPAFDLDPDKPDDQRRWVEAWLQIYTILDQGNHAATRSGIAANPLMIEILADSFVEFVQKGDAAALGK